MYFFQNDDYAKYLLFANLGRHIACSRSRVLKFLLKVILADSCYLCYNDGMNCVADTKTGKDLLFQ